jgi:hypothetical protein
VSSSSISSSGQHGLLSSLALAQPMSESTSNSNSGNQKKLKVSVGDGDGDPDRGPPVQQIQKPPPPNLEDADDCAKYLGFNEGFESIINRKALSERVKYLRGIAGNNEEWKNDIREARDRILTKKGDLFTGGKRRTMKVKKQFRKTKRRIYKNVKKTRLRRNNKSKRVLKEKRRR